jgi:hypothetical protein
VELIASLAAFFALVAAWFVLPASPRRVPEVRPHSVPEALPTAA